MLMIKGMILVLIQPLIFAVLLLIPAGTWNWPRALLLIGSYALILEVTTVVLALAAPKSLAARLQVPVSKKMPKAERVVVLFFYLSLFAWGVFIPIDVFRLHLFPAPSLMVSIIGAAVFLAGYGIITATIYQNEFATLMVEDQRKRGQVLVDSGLYGVIRHPLYLGFFPYAVGMALWLESYAAALLFPLVFIFLVIRIFVEEKYLRETLPGYVEYMKRVRYRLFPFIW